MVTNFYDKTIFYNTLLDSKISFMIAHSKKTYTFSTTAETTSDLIPLYVICFMFTKGTGRRERRCKQLPDDQKTKKYWKLKEETLDRTLWRTFGKRDGSVIRLRNDDDG